MSHTLISIIVPVYGVEKYIEKCAHSLFCQTIKDGVEFIFVDDCTRDNSIGILKDTLKQFPNRAEQVKIIHHSENKGLASARNTGLSHAQGQYVLNVDSDDWLEEKTVETLLENVVNTNADIIVFDFNVVYSKKSISYNQIIPATGKEYFKKMLRGETKYSACNKLIRKSIFEEYGIRWIDGLNMGEDMSVIPRVTYFANRIVHLGLPLYNYNLQNEDSYTHVWGEKAIQNVKEASNIIVDFTNGNDSDNEFSNSLKIFELNNTYEILAHCPMKEITKFLSIIRKPTVREVLNSNLPTYVKLTYSLYILNHPKLGRTFINYINCLKRKLGY